MKISTDFFACSDKENSEVMSVEGVKTLNVSSQIITFTFRMIES